MSLTTIPNLILLNSLYNVTMKYTMVTPSCDFTNQKMSASYIRWQLFLSKKLVSLTWA